MHMCAHFRLGGRTPVPCVLVERAAGRRVCMCACTRNGVTPLRTGLLAYEPLATTICQNMQGTTSPRHPAPFLSPPPLTCMPHSAHPLPTEGVALPLPGASQSILVIRSLHLRASLYLALYPQIPTDGVLLQLPRHRGALHHAQLLQGRRPHPGTVCAALYLGTICFAWLRCAAAEETSFPLLPPLLLLMTATSARACTARLLFPTLLPCAARAGDCRYYQFLRLGIPGYKKIFHNLTIIKRRLEVALRKMGQDRGEAGLLCV